MDGVRSYLIQLIHHVLVRTRPPLIDGGISRIQAIQDPDLLRSAHLLKLTHLLVENFPGRREHSGVGEGNQVRDGSSVAVTKGRLRGGKVSDKYISIVNYGNDNIIHKNATLNSVIFNKRRLPFANQTRLILKADRYDIGQVLVLYNDGRQLDLADLARGACCCESGVVLGVIRGVFITNHERALLY